MNFFTGRFPRPQSAQRIDVDVSVGLPGKRRWRGADRAADQMDPAYAFAAVKHGRRARGRLRVRGCPPPAIAVRGALEGGLRRQGEDLQTPLNYSLGDFTLAQSIAGLDAVSIQRALGQTAEETRPDSHDDAVVAAVAGLRSGDLVRIRRVLRAPPTTVADWRADSAPREEGDPRGSGHSVDGVRRAWRRPTRRCVARPGDALTPSVAGSLSC